MSAPFGKPSPCRLVEVARMGGNVTRADKIRSIASLEEMNGFQSEMSRRGETLTTDEMRAVIEKREALRRLR